MVTTTSMLMSTAYRLSSGNAVPGAVDKTLSFGPGHRAQCMALLDELLKFELYTKPDPNNPHFHANCLTVRGCIDDNIRYLSHALPRTAECSQTDPAQFYSEIAVMLWQLAHCPLNVEITEDQQDTDTLSDRESIESVDNLRRFLMVQLHHRDFGQFVVEALSRCWTQLLVQIEALSETELMATVKRKYSSTNIQMESMVLVLPHLILMLAQRQSTKTAEMVQCLLCALQIMENVETVSVRMQTDKSSQQMYGLMVPLFLQLALKDTEEEEETTDDDEDTKQLILNFLADGLNEKNVNLVAALQALPKAVVAALSAQITALPKRKTKKKEKTPKELGKHSLEKLLFIRKKRSIIKLRSIAAKF